MNSAFLTHTGSACTSHRWGTLTVAPQPSLMVERKTYRSTITAAHTYGTKLFGFFDDLMKGDLFQNDEEEDRAVSPKQPKDRSDVSDDDDIMWNEADFRSEVQKRNEQVDAPSSSTETNALTTIGDGEEQEEEREFDGYALRDAIYNKWGQCFDVDFQPVTTFGFRELYLNVMPFRLGGKRFRHETELDYLCHLQAVVSAAVRTFLLGDECQSGVVIGNRIICNAHGMHLFCINRLRSL